ncbi:MAG: hypothetical protein IJO08_02415 [Clostridia bacterium]|nr:hypothetical protein [Clostridia bacterium]
MVDKEIKRKIDSKEEITATELIKYFNQLPAPIEKGLFKKFRQRKLEATHNETKEYLLDHFDTVLDSISVNQLSKFFENFYIFSHKKEIFEKLSENHLRLAELLNNSSASDLSLNFTAILTNQHDAHVFFEKNFEQFYANTTSEQFSIQQFFLMNPLSDKICPLILDGMCDSLTARSIRKEDIPFFLHEYIYNKTSNDRVFWNETRTPITKIPEDTKTLIQKDKTPEDALYLIQSTDKPLYVRQLLQSVGLENPKIIEHLNTHLDDIVQEISEYSRDSLTINMIVKELMEHENSKPSDIKYSAKGGFGKVFKIGDKILKYGRKAHNAELPYNSELFLQPLLRQSLSGSDFLEIYEQVDVGGSREDMYQLYKALREQGLIWTDIKPGNFGRLRKENRVHFEGIDSVSHRAVGFREDKEIPIAQPGNLVLIDLDFVFLEGTKFEVPQEGTAMNNFREFTSRYQKEKEAENNPTKTQIKTQKTDIGEI